MKEKLLEIVNELCPVKDGDIILKMIKAKDFAYKDRCFYIAEIQLDDKNNNDIVLKIGWTRVNTVYRYSDKRNGYLGVHKTHKEFILNAKLCEELEEYIKKKYVIKEIDIVRNYKFMGKTEAIFKYDEILIQTIITDCEEFIKNYNGELGRGRVN